MNVENGRPGDAMVVRSYRSSDVENGRPGDAMVVGGIVYRKLLMEMSVAIMDRAPQPRPPAAATSRGNEAPARHGTRHEYGTCHGNGSEDKRSSAVGLC